MNVIETTKGELYNAVPHIPARSYEKDVYYERTDQEDVANWIAEQLRDCGFDTHPVGSSWGKLKNEL